MRLFKKILLTFVFAIFVFSILFYIKTSIPQNIVSEINNNESKISYNYNFFNNLASQTNVNIVINSFFKILKKTYLNILDSIEKIKNSIFYSPKQFVSEYEFFCNKINLYRIIFPFHFFL